MYVWCKHMCACVCACVCSICMCVPVFAVYECMYVCTHMRVRSCITLCFIPSTQGISVNPNILFFTEGGPAAPVTVSALTAPNPDPGGWSYRKAQPHPALYTALEI